MKIFNFFLIFTFLGGGVLFALDEFCPFCDADILAKQFVHETNEIVTLYCLTPATKGNILIIPKRHIERFDQLTIEELQAFQREVYFFSKVFTFFYQIPEFVIIQKNGKNAGQSVAHLHFHMIPASRPFKEIVHDAFHFRKKLSDKEMKIRSQELQNFLITMP